MDDVLPKLPEGEFTLAQVAELIDRPTATTRNYVNKLKDLNLVEIVGDDPNHDGRGKAPKLYKLA